MERHSSWQLRAMLYGNWALVLRRANSTCTWRAPAWWRARTWWRCFWASATTWHQSYKQLCQEPFCPWTWHQDWARQTSELRRPTQSVPCYSYRAQTRSPAAPASEDTLSPGNQCGTSHRRVAVSCPISSLAVQDPVGRRGAEGKSSWRVGQCWLV